MERIQFLLYTSAFFSLSNFFLVLEVRIVLDRICMVAERVTPSPRDTPPGPGLRIQQHRTPDTGIYGSGLRDQRYQSPDELKIPDSGLRIAQYRTRDPGIYGPDMHISMVVHVLWTRD